MDDGQRCVMNCRQLLRSSRAMYIRRGGWYLIKRKGWWSFARHPAYDLEGHACGKIVCCRPVADVRSHRILCRELGIDRT